MFSGQNIKIFTFLFGRLRQNKVKVKVRAAREVRLFFHIPAITSLICGVVVARAAWLLFVLQSIILLFSGDVVIFDVETFDVC